MGAIAGVFGSSENSREVVENLLFALRHRGAKTTVSAMGEEHAGWTIGYSSNVGIEPHFLESARGVLALDGSFFQHQNNAQFAYRRLVKGTTRHAATALMSEPGEFAVLGNIGNRMIAFRDLNGLKPLYLGARRRFVAIASERKALWKIGLRDVTRVHPGHLYSISNKGTTQVPIAMIKRLPEKPIAFDRAASLLTRLLKRSIRRVTMNKASVAVGFSGGLDSAVVAELAKNVAEVELVSVGLVGSSELATAEKYAHQIDLPVTIEPFEPDSLEDYVRRVVWLIEEPNLMKVSVAIPLHWAAMVAARLGHSVMLCGQGSDELYGGYYKYAKLLDTKGRRALVNALYRSVIQASEVNYERDEQATTPFGVELRTPFADLDVVRFSLTIPSNYKVKTGNDVTRKWILRSVAKGLGLPDDIVWRRKKAIQHGTGVENAIRRLAKNQNLTVDSYLSKIHADVKDLESMP